jgi:hypothetical protein
MKTTQIFRNSFLGFLGMIFSTVLWAHGGAAGTDTDQCKFELEKDHWLHYTAYQPNAYPAKEFCGSLPDINALTQLVFDYQDQRYRNMAIEFEVTKEPEGKRVFFSEAKKHKSGTVVLNMPDGVAEQGKYLIHITLLQDNGDRLDAHMSFKAGVGQPASKSKIGIYIVAFLTILYLVYLTNARFKRTIGKLVRRTHAESKI